MKKQLTAAALCLSLLTGGAGAADLPTLQVNGEAVDAVSYVEQGTTYVALRAVSRALDETAEILWEDGSAVVRTEELELSAVPGEQWILANGRYLYVPGGVRLREGTTLVPVRVLADAFGAQVEWNGETEEITLFSGQYVPAAEYDEQEVYWLSRIISAESRGESLQGQIAVGNVVLNRVGHPDFPNTVYGVIFDNRWGGQFEPVKNGTVYETPTERCTVAAKLCLEGTDMVGESLYFFDPIKAQNFWISENRTFLTQIGVHHFYL